MGFVVAPVAYAARSAALHDVRRRVFVDEQGVPPGLEQDAWDAGGRHVLACDAAGMPIGAGRLLADGRIGRMAVLPGWRGRGVGEAMLQALVEMAIAAGLRQVHLHAQLPACGFYIRQGFLPAGEVFEEAGLLHQQMSRALGTATAITGPQAAIAAATAIVHRARRRLWIHSRQLEPGLLDAAPVQAALRRFATRRQPRQLRLIVDDAAAVQAAGPPLLVLMQRLPSAVQLREVADPADRALGSACLVNDRGDYYVRRTGDLRQGEAAIALPSRAQPFSRQLQALWERSRDGAGLRALGL